MQYVGKTSQKARKRFSGHRNNVESIIDTTSKSEVGHHYSENGHKISDMEFRVIEQVRHSDPFILNARESYWIQQYGGVENLLNKEE